MCRNKIGHHNQSEAETVAGLKNDEAVVLHSVLASLIILLLALGTSLLVAKVSKKLESIKQ